MRKKFSKMIMLVCSIFLIITIFGSVSAAQINRESMDLELTRLRSSGYGYYALEKTVWKIIESGKSTSVNNATIYCLNGGVGFNNTFAGNSSTSSAMTYSVFYDMREPLSNTYFNQVPSTTNGTYNSLMWLLDNMYIPSDTSSDSLAYKTWLLDQANVHSYSDLRNNTNEMNDIIDVVQQIAIWHYTNNGQTGTYDSGSTSVSLKRNGIAWSDSNYASIGDWLNVDEYLTDDINDLYKYLIKQADANSKYDYSGASSGGSYNFSTGLTITDTVSGSYTIVGPFKINDNSSSNTTFDAVITNNGTDITSKVTIKVGNSTKSNIEATIGSEFYVYVPSSIDVNNFKIDISGSSLSTDIILASVSAASTGQPVAIIERNYIPYSDTINYSPEEVEYEVDLALRKFITKIDNVVQSSNRVPDVDIWDLDDLADGTVTTVYKDHIKTPLLVKTGSIVEYTLRIYNEGEVNAIAQEVTDYLPEGLKFVPASESATNTTYGWSVSSDGRIVTTDYLKNTVINAFDGLNLKYVDIKIECEVTAAYSGSGQTLVNIAEITKDSDENGNNVTDRDSTPGNVDLDDYDKKLESQEDDDDYEVLILDGEIFDLALRKYITEINNIEVSVSREPVISNLSSLYNNTITTATKTHPKNALLVENDDIVKYSIVVYNEGEVDGYASEIKDYLPAGLEFVTDSEINAKYGWTVSNDGKTITTTYLKDTLLAAFSGSSLDSAIVEIECRVTANTSEEDQYIVNVADISKYECLNASGTRVQAFDRDSYENNVDVEDYDKELKSNNYNSINIQEDDDDYELLVLIGQYYDLALRKFIVEINGERLVDENGNYLREPTVDVTPLISGSTTATYNHTKTPINVSVGDEIVYILRVYNEGQLDAYVSEITDYLPEYLEYINNEDNSKYGWNISGDGRVVTTDITSPTTENSATSEILFADRTDDDDKLLLKAFDVNSEDLDYIEVEIKCKVLDTASLGQKVTNIAEITEMLNADEEEVTSDRDSTVDNLTLPSDSILPSYKDDEINSGKEYIEGQQDDDDFEKVIVQKFDLSLRKFITQVNDNEITNRIPVYSKDEDGNHVYTHTKVPVEVANNDVVIYTLRIYNEGNQNGYATEVKDDLPEGLEFLPEAELNIEYRWVMYDEEGNITKNVLEATNIRTDYLSKDQEDETGRDNLLVGYDQDTMTQPDFKDVKIAFKITEPNTSDRILINTAEISEDSDENGDPIEDEDSTPDNDEEDEDDIDKEYVKVKYFDLALDKIVSAYSITIDGKTTVTQTGHEFYVYPEPIVKIELTSNGIKTYIIKYTYQLLITNEGEIAGYATEIKDHIPEGLKFNEDENPDWVMLEDGKTVVTDQLKDTLLEPGDSVVIDIILEWINGEDNLGLKTNWAEISDDWNESDTPDIDSTPDNYEKEEDDIDDASTLVSVKTGIEDNYIFVILGVLVIISSGLIVIKRYFI